jgi:hypothetical protein
MPKVYLTRRRGWPFDRARTCPVCRADDPRRHAAYAFAHPNPLRANVTLWRCRRHARVGFVPLDEKRGLGGGVYR